MAGFELLAACSLLFAGQGTESDDSHLQCGLHCLFVGMVALDVEAKLDEVEGKLGAPQAGGYSLADLKRVAEGYGLKTAAVRTSAENLARRNERFACIAHVRGHHFVMITDVDLDKGLVSMLDPPRSIQQVPLATFTSTWAGDALLISPTTLESEESVTARAPWFTKSVQRALGWGVLVAVIAVTFTSMVRIFRRKASIENSQAGTAGAFLSLIACGSLMSSCQQTAPPLTATAAPPSLLLINPSLDLGEFVVSATGQQASFEIQNRGGETLLIVEVHSGCGCALVKAIEKEVAPGETRRIEVQLRTAHPEDRTTRISLKSNDPLFPVQSQELHWRVRAPLEFEPLRWDIGKVRPGAEVRTQVKLLKRHVAHRTPGTVSEFTATGGVVVEAVEPAADGAYDLLTLKLTAGQTSGQNHTVVSASVEGSEQKYLSLPVTWTVQPPYVPQPERVFLGIAKPGQELMGRVVVSTDLPTGLQLTGTSGLKSLAGSEIEIQPLEQQQAAVQIKVTAPHVEGVFRDELQLQTNDGTMLAIPISGIVRTGGT